MAVVSILVSMADSTMFTFLEIKNCLCFQCLLIPSVRNGGSVSRRPSLCAAIDFPNVAEQR